MKKEKQKRGKKQIVLIVAGIVIGVLAVIYLAFAFYFHSHRFRSLSYLPRQKRSHRNCPCR